MTSIPTIQAPVAITVTLTPSELAAIRCGLDLAWCHAHDGWPEDGQYEMATAGETCEALEKEEIIALMNRITTAAQTA